MPNTGKLGTSKSLLGNILLGAESQLAGGGSGDFTADAVLLATQTTTFTADAILATAATTVSGSFTADAVLLATISGTFTANADLKKTVAATFTADATLAGLTTFTANAVLLKTVNRTFLANSDLKKEQGPFTYTADAYFGSTPAAPVLIFEDDFSRTTSAGNFGNPSGGGQELLQFSFPDNPPEFYVDEQLIVPETVDGDQELGFWFQPHSPEFEVVFDFLTNVNGFYRMWGPQVYDPAGTGSFKYFNPRADIYDDTGDGTTWFITSGFSAYATKTLTVNTMHRARVQVIGRTVKIRVWNPATESEPTSWDTVADQVNGLFNDEFSRAGFLVDWEQTPAGEGRLDNIEFYRLGEDTRGFFTANALINQGGVTFTADAVLKVIKTRTFTADAVLGLPEGIFQFSADSYLIARPTETFIADAYLTPIPKVYAFYVNAVLAKPALDVASPTIFRKTKTIRIAQRRPRAASNFIPPKLPDNDDRDKSGSGNIDEPPCLPPCPGDTSLTSNATTIRTSVIRCTHANFYLWTPDNKLGLGDRSIADWHDHADSHNGQDDTYRMWVQYGNVPSSLFEMHAKLAWYWDDESTINFPEFSDVPYGTPVTVEVYANVALPPTQPDVPINFGGDESWWNSGTLIGRLSFMADAGGYISDPPADHGWQWQQRRSKIVIDPGFLSTSTFKFKLSDETNTLGAKIKAPNLEITISGLS